jgi:hypothetical protein
MNKSIAILLALSAVTVFANVGIRTPRHDIQFDESVLRHQAIIREHGLHNKMKTLSVGDTTINYAADIF